MRKPVFIASDVHLGVVPDQTERAFVEFLDHVGQAGSELILAGDLFDFWFEYGDVIPGLHFRTLAAIARLTDAGIPVTFAGGNHDAWGGRFFRKYLGMQVYDHLFHMDLPGGKALIAHGDGVGKGDFKYRMLKAFVRSRFAIYGFRALHPELGLKLARRVSSTDLKPAEVDQLSGRARFLEAWAREQMAIDPGLSWVVCGHSHVPAVIEVGPGRYYLNAGDWLTHFTYIEIDEAGVPALRTWLR
ncbi:MAG: UDP-2,3-diacylglucosamine diphosphatase [Longimicrobiales bacterium]